MEEARPDGFDPASQRRLYRRAGVRSLLTVTSLMALYYLLPLNRSGEIPLVLTLGAGLLVVVVIGAWQVRAVLNARYPAVQAVEALAAAIPLFLLLFAGTYSRMSTANPDAFTEPLNRTDALYFTVTIFATVGFGDIAPVATPARVLVTVQMVCNLLILGVLLQAFLGAVKLGRARRHAPAD